MGAERITLGDAQRYVKQAFFQADIEAAEIEARRLVAGVFDKNPTSLITDAGEEISLEGFSRIRDMVERRLGGEPLGRLLGSVEFFGLEFELNSHTLQPRSDTENLVECVLLFLEEHKNTEPNLVDLGTGSGAIIISLLANLRNAQGVGSDISAKALEAAKNNALKNGVSDRLELVQSDWCEKISGKFDVIVSNPPYICSETIPALAKEVRDYDPELALDGGSDGLDAYRKILDQTPELINRNGRLFVEIGYDQAAAIRREAESRGWVYAGLAKDLDGNDRVLMFEIQ